VQEAKPEPDWKKRNRIVTVKGCLQSPSADVYTLTTGRTQPVTTSAGDSTPGATTLLIYTLLPNRKKLRSYLDQHVEVTGRIAGEYALALELRLPHGATPAPDAPAATTSVVAGPTTDAQLTVLRVKRLADTCER
jgi:hypothetical protein